MLVRIVLLILFGVGALADWPMLRGSAAHTGFVPDELPRSFRLSWAVEFENERLGTRSNPSSPVGRFLLQPMPAPFFALDAKTGEALWKFTSPGAFLHSPAYANNLVICANAEGSIYALEAGTGVLRWRHAGPTGGYAAAPIIAGGKIFIGSRSGEWLALNLEGVPLWRLQFPAPIRQTAAFHKGRIFVMAEDLRLRCFDEAGKLLWTSEPAYGQTARDYYPVVLERGGKTFVIVRTNPLLTMSQRIGRDRTMLARNAGFEDSGWQKIDAWIKSDQARGTPALWQKEQQSITRYLEENRDAATFHVFDAATGKRQTNSPVLWIAGCQAVGAPPAATWQNDLFTFYRSAYGNWNHGVAPLVALGLLDLEKNRIAPLFHQSGKQPPWNTFWGTADESQNFVVAGDTVLIVHQGTLSGFDLRKNELFKIHGERDTFGFFRNPPWARNEWHGPARAGVAISNGRIYWQTGSRVLCVEPGQPGPAAEVRTVTGEGVRTNNAPPGRLRARAAVLQELNRVAEEILSQRWAPLFIDPGLNGREFIFSDSSDLFAAFAAAHRFLSIELKPRALAVLGAEFKDHPPFTAAGRYALREGHPREWFSVPPEYRAAANTDSLPHPFGGLSATLEWAGRTGQGALVSDQWDAVKESFESFRNLKWTFDPAKGDLHANRYIESLHAFARLAAGRDPELAEKAAEQAKNLAQARITWWKNAAQSRALRIFKGSAELDPFITRGDALSFRVSPHRHKIAIFRDLAQDAFRDALEEDPESVSEVWSLFRSVRQTWPLQGEERQVHFGENFVDTPDLALGAFKLMGWLGENSLEDLNGAIDLPICRADIYYLHKLALYLEN